MSDALRPLTDDLAESARRHMRNAFRMRAREVARKLTDADLRDRIMRMGDAYSDIRVRQLGKQIAASTPRMVEGTLQRALDERWSPGELREALASDYAFSEDRLVTIARSETMMARRAGAEAIAQLAGASQKRFTPEFAQCDECMANVEAGWIDADDEFPYGTDVHPNCIHDVEYRRAAPEEVGD